VLCTPGGKWKCAKKQTNQNVPYNVYCKTLLGILCFAFCKIPMYSVVVPKNWKYFYTDGYHRDNYAVTLWTFNYQHSIDRTNSSTVLPLVLTNDKVTTCGHSLKLHKRECRTLLSANVLDFRIVDLWNFTAEHAVSAPSSNTGQFQQHKMHIYVIFLHEKIGLQVQWPIQTETRW